jgi:thiol:disulfide interchange protein
MKILIAVATLALATTGCEKSKANSAPAPSKTASEPGATVAPDGSRWVELPPKDVVAALKAESARSAAAGIPAYLYLHADWCEPCVAIENTRETDPGMKAAFANVQILAVDIDAADPKQLASLGLTVDSIPVFHKVNPAGEITGASIGGDAWGDNIPENMAPPLTAFFNGKSR